MPRNKRNPKIVWSALFRRPSSLTYSILRFVALIVVGLRISEKQGSPDRWHQGYHIPRLSRNHRHPRSHHPRSR